MRLDMGPDADLDIFVRGNFLLAGIQSDAPQPLGCFQGECLPIVL